MPTFDHTLDRLMHVIAYRQICSLTKYYILIELPRCDSLDSYKKKRKPLEDISFMFNIYLGYYLNYTFNVDLESQPN